MKTTSSNLAVKAFVILPILLIILIVSYCYNNLVGKEEDVFDAWSQLESNYQLRQDLIPNIVSTVKAYAAHEKETISDTTAQRTALLNSAEKLEAANKEAKQSKSDSKSVLADEAKANKMSSTQQHVSEQYRQFLITVENYPTLRASEQFLELQSQLEATENQINFTRMNFNEKAKAFNESIRKIPGSFVAGLGNFKRKAYFKSEPTANKPIKVEFNN